MGLLDGIRVLDVSRLFPGPFCSMMLADMGAEVIKIEDPVQGDYLRWMPPYIGKDSAHFLALNRNKKSVRLNLRSAEGLELFLRLAEKADVVMESFRPGVMKKMGADYEAVRARNPRIVYCAITGYGQTGPYSGKPGHDLNYVGYAGALGMSGAAGGPPAIPGVQAADLGGGALMGAIGILAALVSRQSTGEGRMIDVSMSDGAASWLPLYAAQLLAGNPAPTRGEDILTGASPFYGVYETKDGKYLAVANIEPKFWKEFCVIIDRLDLETAQFEMGKKKDELAATMREIFKGRTRKEWLDLFEGREVCIGPVNSLEEVFDDPHFREREVLIEFDHPVHGRLKQLAHPIKYSNFKPGVRLPPPGFGEHTAEILGEIGVAAAELAELEKKKVV